ncbi:hypothetical protein Ahy_A03g015218 isoform F [Arachis hypogaea]|uniref:Uncharacterized protein n=1 Tax=Arachis hypogaea TaxID=3818 RepID=A0A445DZU2_ARAHY|nr:hypothetical protein Ahy_A03g015218 isoform F [Arachis hypogaea]
MGPLRRRDQGSGEEEPRLARNIRHRRRSCHGL